MMCYIYCVYTKTSRKERQKEHLRYTKSGGPCDLFVDLNRSTVYSAGDQMLPNVSGIHARVRLSSGSYSHHADDLVDRNRRTRRNERRRPSIKLHASGDISLPEQPSAGGCAHCSHPQAPSVPDDRIAQILFITHLSYLSQYNYLSYCPGRSMNYCTFRWGDIHTTWYLA
jgi:hypothetical protein